MAIKESNLHLTELILSIHNEVQSALDYISEVSLQEGTELGRSTALLGVQTLRIKLPFEVEIEQKMGKFPPSVKDDRIASIKSNLVMRKGFAIDVGDLNKRALLTKIKVRALSKAEPVSAAEEDGQPAKTGMAELEITFSPYKRD
jgi:hypothetical protein